MFARLDQASARTGLPVNSIVVAACLEWMQRHTPTPDVMPRSALSLEALQANLPVGPRWATINRAMRQATKRRETAGMYPFDRFSDHAKEMLKVAQQEAEKSGHSYIGTEHLLLAAFSQPDFYSAKVLAGLGIAEDAVRSAIDSALGTNNILLALAAEGEGIAARVLSDLGATKDKIASAMGELAEPEP